MKALILILIIMLSGCDLAINPTWKIVYQVTATESVYSVTIRNENGGTSQFSDVSIPWSYSFTGEPGDFVYVSAGGYGTVTVRILKDGKVFKTSTSIGSPVIASASGSL